MGLQRGVALQHGPRIARGLQDPGADVELVGAQREDRVVELARHRERPPARALRFDALEVDGRGARRSVRRDRRRAPRVVEHDLHELVVEAIGPVVALERRQQHGLRIRAMVPRGDVAGAVADGLRELPRLRDPVDQPPFARALAAHALGGRAEDVGEVAAHLALVDEAREPAGARQHAEQRHLGKRHRRGAVVHQDDLVAREGELVAAARARAVHRGDEADAGLLRRILDAVARLVGELAEVDLPRVAGGAEHEDVGAGAEDAVLRAGEDHHVHLGMLEADALQRVGELDVHAQVVRVELELVARADAAVLGHVHGERGDRTLEGELPVAVARGIRTKVDPGRGFVHRYIMPP